MTKNTPVEKDFLKRITTLIEDNLSDERFGVSELADKIGLDTIVRWLDNLYIEFGDLKYKASPLLKKMVRANHLGRETGRGFYEYDADGKKVLKY